MPPTEELLSVVNFGYFSRAKTHKFYHEACRGTEVIKGFDQSVSVQTAFEEAIGR